MPEVPLSYRNVGRAEQQAIVANALDRFQIVAKKDLYPSQLSGGQQQLVGVTRAVIANPKSCSPTSDRKPPFGAGSRNHDLASSSVQPNDLSQV